VAHKMLIVSLLRRQKHTYALTNWTLR
jgi:hypothetical protein